MGKGMPAAIVAATARAALRSGAATPNGDRPSPAATLARAANILAPDLAATDTFVTAFVAVLTDHGRIHYADAGHGHTGIVRADGTTEPLQRGRPPIGVDFDIDATLTDHTVELRPGDLLIAHSDGLLELPFGPRTTEHLLARLHGRTTTADDALAAIGDMIGTATPNRRPHRHRHPAPTVTRTTMNIALEPASDGHTLVAITGRLDLGTAGTFRSAIEHLLHDGTTNVIVDLARVTFIDSSGLGALIGAYRHTLDAGGSLRIVAPTPDVQDLLTLMRLDRVLPAYPTVDAARATP